MESELGQRNCFEVLIDLKIEEDRDNRCQVLLNLRYIHKFSIKIRAKHHFQSTS